MALSAERTGKCNSNKAARFSNGDILSMKLYTIDTNAEQSFIIERAECTCTRNYVDSYGFLAVSLSQSFECLLDICDAGPHHWATCHRCPALVRASWSILFRGCYW